jgi:hypothetical protein
MQMNHAVTFLSDGVETVHDLRMYLNPHAEHLLDSVPHFDEADDDESASQEHRDW